MSKPAIELARRTEIRVTIDKKDVSAVVNKYLSSLTYIDTSKDEADDLQLSFDDRDNEWINWLGPAGNDLRGTTITAAIVQKNRYSDGKDAMLDCGQFEIDSIDCSGPPQNMNMKGLAIPQNSALRSEIKNKAWEENTLKNIAAQIATEGGLTLFYEAQTNPSYNRVDQANESDITFLQRLCWNCGITIKVTAKMLVLYEESTFEKKDAARTFEKGKGDIISYQFSTGVNEVYNKSEVSYTDPKTKKTIKGEFVLRGYKKDDPVLNTNEKVASVAEAKTLAEKKLREHNRGEYRASFTVVGDVGLLTGVTIQVSGYGMYDGKYIIEAATHTVNGSGYQTSIELHRVLEGY